MLDLPMLFGAFQPPKPHRAGRHAASGAYIYILGSHTDTLYMDVPVTIKCVLRRSFCRASAVEKLRAAWANQALPRSFDSAPRALCYAINL
jgi:hypothetical protein